MYLINQENVSYIYHFRNLNNMQYTHYFIFWMLFAEMINLHYSTFQMQFVCDIFNQWDYFKKVAAILAGSTLTFFYLLVFS